MRSGRLDRQIELQTLTKSQGAAGGSERSWSTLDNVYAEVSQRQGDEANEGDQKHDDQTYIFRIRFRTDVDSASTRIKYAGDTYDIQGVQELGRREALQIKARRQWT